MKKIITLLIFIIFFSSTYTQVPFRTGNVKNCWTLNNLAKEGGIKTCYEDAIPWEHGRGCLKQGEKWAVYCQNSQEKIVISEPIFDKVLPLNGFFCYQDKETHKYGLVNDTFAILSPAKYDSIGLFARWVYTRIEPPMPREMKLYNMPYAIVKNEQKYGLIDEYGKEITPCKYAKMLALNSFTLYDVQQKSNPDSFITQDYHFYAVQKKHKYALFQVENRKYSPFKYDKISPVEKSEYYFEVHQKGGYGLMDTACKEILPCIYNRIWVWNDSLLYVKKGKVCGVMDHTGKTILPFIFEEIAMVKEYDADGHFYFKTRKNKQIATWSNRGKPFTLTKIQEEDISTISNSIYHGYQITLKNGKWGVIYPIEGDVIIPFLYEKIIGKGDGFWVRKDNKWNRMNFDGQKIGDLDYDWIVSQSLNGQCIVSKNEKMGIYDAYTDKEIVTCNYENLRKCTDDYDRNNVYSYTKQGLYGFIYFAFANEEAQTISPALFDEFEVLTSYTPLISVKVKGESRIWNMERQDYFYSREISIVSITHLRDALSIIVKESTGFKILKINKGSLIPNGISPLWENYRNIPYHSDLLWVFRDEKWQIFDTFLMKIDPQYEKYDAMREVDGYYIVEKEGKKGLLCPKLQNLISCINPALNVKDMGNNILAVQTTYGKYYFKIPYSESYF